MSPKTSIITTYLLALLASLIAAQTVREHLDRFCPSRNGQEVQLEERLFVTYHCGKAPEDWGLLESYPAAMDPEACSRACVASSTCKGSLYSAQPANRRAPCVLYSGATEPVLEDMDRVLWMSYRKVSPLDPVDCKEELELVGELEDKVSGLQREMEQLKKDLEACQASSGGEEGDGGDNGGGEEGGENAGNDGGSGTGPNDAVCARNDENVFSNESRRWELHTDRYTRYGTGANNDLGRDSPYFNIAECIHQCSQIPKCRMVYFHIGLRTCFFATRPRTLSGRAPNYDAAWALGSYNDAVAMHGAAVAVKVCPHSKCFILLEDSRDWKCPLPHLLAVPAV